jgi:uncharacterized protein YegP (UPF0339 family)
MKKEQKQIVEREFILSGTIIKRFGPCGKSNCRCAHNKKYWHGPYYIWTRKENGKTVTQSLSVAQAQFCEKAINSMKKLNAQIERWKQESIAVLKNHR